MTINEAKRNRADLAVFPPPLDVLDMSLSEHFGHE